MKLFVSTITIGIIAVTILYFTREGIFYDLRPKEESQSEPTVIQFFNSYILPPHLFLDVIGKDSNYIAGVFHNVSFDRERDGSMITFTSVEEGFEHQRIFYKDDIPATLFYVIESKWQADAFLDSIKASVGSKLISDSSSQYPSYQIKNCIFIDTGYYINNKGFTFQIFDADLRLRLINEKRVKDSLELNKAIKARAVDSLTDRNKTKVKEKRTDPFEDDEPKKTHDLFEDDEPKK